MRKLTYLVASTIDGKIAKEDGAWDCFMQFGDEHAPDYLAALQTFDAVVMGLKTYEVGLKEGLTDPYPHLATYVFSSTLKESPNKKVTVVAGDPAEFVAKLKSQPGGDIYLCGGGKLAGALMAAGLIDQVDIKLYPLIMGPGIPLFEGAVPVKLMNLKSSKVYGNGVVLLTYEVRN